MDPCLDLVGRSGTVHDNGILFLDLYLFCAAQLIHRSIFQLQPQFFADYLSARQDKRYPAAFLFFYRRNQALLLQRR